jgi:hypothetical protein
MDYSWATSPRTIQTAASVVAALVVVILVWYIYTHRAKLAKSDGPFDLRNDEVNKGEDQKWFPVFDADQTQLSAGNNITMSFFVYVKDLTMDRIPVNYDGSYRFQYLLTIGNIVGFIINPVKQECIVDVLQTPPHGYNTNRVEQKAVVLRSTTIPHVMISRWNQIAICIEGRSVDLYLNGDLVSSIQLDNLPLAPMNGVLLNSSPDFMGQACLFQMWPERRTIEQIRENYMANTDTRGRPNIPEPGIAWRDVWGSMRAQVCDKTGLCAGIDDAAAGPLNYVEYQFA